MLACCFYCLLSFCACQFPKNPETHEFFLAAPRIRGMNMAPNIGNNSICIDFRFNKVLQPTRSNTYPKEVFRFIKIKIRY